MFNQLISHCKTYFRFSLREQKEILISALIFGFIFSFNMWGGEEFNAAIGVKNWVLASVFILLAIAVNLSVNKIISINFGYKSHYHWWLPGILMGFLLTFMTFGFVPFLFPGVFYFEHMKGLRLGQFRHGANIKDFALSAIWGVVSNVFLALVLGFFYVSTGNYWVLFFIKINLIYAFFSMLPIPTIAGVKMGEGATAGLTILYFSRPLYVFIFASLLAYGILVYLLITIFGSLGALIIAMILGLLAYYFFMTILEKSI